MVFEHLGNLARRTYEYLGKTATDVHNHLSAPIRRANYIVGDGAKMVSHFAQKHNLPIAKYADTVSLFSNKLSMGLDKADSYFNKGNKLEIKEPTKNHLMILDAFEN